MTGLVTWLARFRVRLGFAVAIAAVWFADPTRRTVAAGAVVACAGEALRVWAAGHLEKGREVTMSGPYRFTRHPLYAGSLLIGIGFAMASASLVSAALVVGYMAATLTAAMRSEERHLTEKFGQAYPDYRDGRAGAGTRRFSVRRAMGNREYRAVAGLLLMLALLAWKVL